MCIERPEEIRIFGGFDTSRASNLMVVYEKCDPRKRGDCKSEPEIEKAMLYSYIVLIENMEDYQHD